MDSCYSVDHIAGDHLQADIPVRNIKEPQQKYRTRMISKRFPGLGELKHVSLDLNPRPLLLQWF